MSTIIKSSVAAITLTICGLGVQHFTRDAGAIDQRVASTELPSEAASSLTADNSPDAGASTTKKEDDNFRQLKNHLQSAWEAAASMPGYSAILDMQEEVSGTLRPVDRIEFKTRREPFSIYMRWNDSAQEALYVHGENDNRLIVKPTKGLAAIRRVWRLEPDCRMAKQNCRYPITDAGLENLVIRIQAFYSQRDDWSKLASFDLEQARIADRDVTIINVTFTDEASVPEYGSSKFCFDTQSKLLTTVDNYGWASDGQRRLIEHYAYEQIVETSTPSDVDFSEENPAYRFVAAVTAGSNE